MKDLGHTKQILGIHITHDRNRGKLWLSQEQHIKKVLKRFNMNQAKPMSCPLVPKFKLSKALSPTNEGDKISYAFTIQSLMYAIVGTRLDITFAVGFTRGKHEVC